MRVVGFSYIVTIYNFGLRVLILAALMSSFAITAYAEESGKDTHNEISDEHKSNVEQMLELMNMPAQVNQAALNVVKQYSATADPSKADVDVQKLIAAYQKDLEKIILPTLSWSGLKTTYIYSYSKRLDEKEVEQITKFYKSEVGKKLIAIQPDSTIEIQKITSHLVESDIQAPLAKLASMLKEGLQKHRALKSAEQ